SPAASRRQGPRYQVPPERRSAVVPKSQRYLVPRSLRRLRRGTRYRPDGRYRVRAVRLALGCDDGLFDRRDRALAVELPDVVGADGRLAHRREVQRPGRALVVDVRALVEQLLALLVAGALRAAHGHVVHVADEVG